MVKLKNTGAACSVYKPADGADALVVDHGEVCDAPGELVGESESGDAYLVEHNGETRAWPKARWELVQDKPKPRARGTEEE